MTRHNDDIHWLLQPEAHDYPAAAAYLGLLYDDASVAPIIERLRQAPAAEFKAKDIFRASALALLGISNSHVEKNLRKIELGTALSPLLLVRVPQHAKLIVADGYHRLCAVYTCNEDAVIPVRIVSL